MTNSREWDSVIDDLFRTYRIKIWRSTGTVMDYEYNFGRQEEVLQVRQ